MLRSCSALPQVMQRVEARPLPMGVHQRSAAGQPGLPRPPLRPVTQDGDETVPLVNGGLAAKALKGRQSIAQPQGRPHARVCHGRLYRQICLTVHTLQEPCHCPQSAIYLGVGHVIATVESQLQLML